MIKLQAASKRRFNKVMKRLQDVPGRIDDITFKNAQEAVEDAKRVVPVQTGRLKRSLSVRRGREIRIRANAPYAASVEFGGRGRPAKPYFYPAIRKMRYKNMIRLRSLLKTVTK